jgi:hypothetical protein
MSSPELPASAPQPSQRERVLTLPLAVFLLAVALLVGGGLWSREWSPDLPRAIELLADGDLDGAERTATLARVVELARASEGLRERWAGLLAAVALGDREAFAAARARLPGDAPAVPDAADREWLDLGDPLLANALAAFAAEAAGRRDEARLRWQQVSAQARLSARPFAGELAAAGVQRVSPR